MDNCRTVIIKHSVGRDRGRSYEVLIQRGSVVQDPENRYRHKFEPRTENSYGIEQHLTDTRRDRIENLFDAWDGESRPENVMVEFYLGPYRMDITFGVGGRLNKE